MSDWNKMYLKGYSRIRAHIKKQKNHPVSFNAFKRLIDKFNNTRR